MAAINSAAVNIGLSPEKSKELYPFSYLLAFIQKSPQIITRCNLPPDGPISRRVSSDFAEVISGALLDEYKLCTIGKGVGQDPLCFLLDQPFQNRGK